MNNILDLSLRNIYSSVVTVSETAGHYIAITALAKGVSNLHVSVADRILSLMKDTCSSAAYVVREIINTGLYKEECYKINSKIKAIKRAIRTMNRFIDGVDKIRTISILVNETFPDVHSEVEFSGLVGCMYSMVLPDCDLSGIVVRSISSDKVSLHKHHNVDDIEKLANAIALFSESIRKWSCVFVSDNYLYMTGKMGLRHLFMCKDRHKAHFGLCSINSPNIVDSSANIATVYSVDVSKIRFTPDELSDAISSSVDRRYNIVRGCVLRQHL